MQNRQNGFTLIELLIVVVIIGILAAVAVPFYGQYATEARRTDGHVALQSAAQQMERCRTQNFTYAGCTPMPSPTISDSGHYSIAITAGTTPTATAYQLTATAVTGGSQANDTACVAMTINQLGTTGPDACW